MKGKKLISLLCAAAMTASAFASMAVTASAAESVLWSDTFDGYENSIAHYTKPDEIGNVLIDGTLTAKNEYAKIEGITLYTTDRADDSSYFQLTEDNGTGKALTTQISRFSSNSRGANIVFKEEYAPTNTEDLVLAFKVKAVNDKGTTYDTAIVLNSDNQQEINFESLGVTLGEWTNVKLVITSAGTNVYIGDSTTAAKTLTAKTLSSIKFNGLVNGADLADAQKAAAHPFGYPTISLDDVVVYTTEAGNGLASTVPPAQTHGEANVEYETVPAASAPEGLGLAAKDDFNSATPDRLIYIGTGSESVYSDLNSVILRVGPASDAVGDTKWEIIGNPKTDPELGEKYLKASNNARSTANRGPKMEFKYGEIAERENVVAYFATRLHKNGDKPAEVIFSGDLVASESKGDIASPIAMITTDAAADSGVYACANPLTKVADGGTNVLEVTDDKWVLVKIDAYRSEGKTAGAKISVTVDGEERYIFGSADAYSDMKDNLKKGINTLPFITFRSGNDTTYGVSNTTNDIDNIAVYSSDIEPVEYHTVNVTQDADNTQKITVTSTDADEEASFDGVLIHAAYNTSKQLVGINSYPLEGITKDGKVFDIPAVDVVHTGDKIMVWGSLDKMVPYGLLEVKAGAAQATPEPTATPTLAPTSTPTLEPTAAPTTEPTQAPTATPTTEPSQPTQAPTATPTTEPTAAPTLTPTAAPTLAPTATPEPPVAVWDFEGDSPAQFIDKSADTYRTTLSLENDTILNSKVQKILNANHNARSNVLLDFSEHVVNSVATTVEFDTFFSDNAMAYITLGDVSQRGNDAGGSTGNSQSYTYGDKGAIFNLHKRAGSSKIVGAISNNNNFGEQSGKWLHVSVSADYRTKKVIYNISSDNEVIKTETVDYVNAGSLYMNCIDIFQHNKDGYVLVDNIKVYTEKGTSNTVTINYVDVDGNVIKTAETDATAINTLPYTVDVAKKATFEAEKDGVKYRYTYTPDGSTDTIVAVSDDDKTITLKFTKVAYQNTTFTAKLAEAVKAGVVINVKGTPTDVTAAAVDTAVTTGDDGTASLALLPGTYKYSIDTTPDYSAVEETPVIVGMNNEVILAANSQSLVAMDIDSSAMNSGVLVTTLSSKVIGKVSTNQYADAEKTELMATPADVTWTTSNEGIIVADDGTVTITNAVTAGNYTITATSGSVTADYTLAVTATGTEMIREATEDFEGETNIFGITAKGTAVTDDTMILSWNPDAASDSVKNLGNVLAMGKGNKVAIATFNNAINIENTLNVSFNPYHGWASATKDCYSTIAIKNSNGDELFSYTYYQGSATAATNVTDVRIGGTTVSDFEKFPFQTGTNNGNNANGFELGKQWYVNNEKTAVSVTIDSQGNVTAIFTNDNDKSTVKTKTITGKIEGKILDFKSFDINSSENVSANRALGIDNIVTTIIKAE